MCVLFYLGYVCVYMYTFASCAYIYIHIHIYIWLYIIFQYVDIYVLYFLGRGMHRSKTAHKGLQRGLGIYVRTLNCTDIYTDAWDLLF